MAVTVNVASAAGHEFLATRTLAEKLREQIVAEAGDHDAVMLDFSDVQAVTGAFADELVAKLVEQHQGTVSFGGCNPWVNDTIREAIRRRFPPPEGDGG